MKFTFSLAVFGIFSLCHGVVRVLSFCEGKVRDDMMIFGDDLNTIASPTIDDCAQECNSFSGCYGVSWIAVGVCYMKGGDPDKYQILPQKNVKTVVLKDCSSDKTPDLTSPPPVHTSPNAPVSTSNPSTPDPSDFPVQTNLKSTMWATTTAGGACAMPYTDYVIDDALALGDMPALGYLQVTNNLCGQVLRVNCGLSDVEVIIVDVCGINSGKCGLDILNKTWSELTGKPPGVTTCSAQLTTTRPMGGNAEKCFQRHDGGQGNPWYKSVGVFNTGGKLVKSMTLDGFSGSFNSASSYMDFSGSQFSDSSSLVATYTDGSSVSFLLGDCPWKPYTYVWTG